MPQRREITKRAAQGVETGGAVSDHLTLVGAGAAVVAAPILYAADKSMSKEKKEKIKNVLRKVNKYRASMADKYKRTYRIWTYANIIFGIFLAYLDLITDVQAVSDLWNRGPKYRIFAFCMAVFIVLPFVVQAYTINIYLMRKQRLNKK